VVLLVGWVAAQYRSQDNYFAQRHGNSHTAATGPWQTESGGFISQAVTVRADTGLEVNLRVLRPSVIEEPLPLVVILAGHRTGRDAVGLIGVPGPMVVAALDYPYDGPERPRGIRQSLALIPAARRGLRDTPPAVRLALDWLVTQPWVDLTRVELMGVSLGVPLATTVAVADERISRLWLVHGSGDNRRWIAHNLGSRVKLAPLLEVVAWLLYLVARGPVFDAGSVVGQVSPRPVVIIGARDDARLPEAMVEALYAAAGDPKELLWTDGGHVDRRPENVQQVLDIVRRHLLGPDWRATD
jgi:dienelactone hydrolase